STTVVLAADLREFGCALVASIAGNRPKSKPYPPRSNYPSTFREFKSRTMAPFSTCREAEFGTLLLSIAQRVDFRGIQQAVQHERIVGCQGEPCFQLPRRLAERVEVQDGLNRPAAHCHAKNLGRAIHRALRIYVPGIRRPAQVISICPVCELAPPSAGQIKYVKFMLHRVERGDVLSVGRPARGG